MSNLIPGNQKHLTLKGRLFIEESLERNLSFKEIARCLCKDPTTISKEVKAHRKHEPHFTERLFYNAKNFCTHRFRCRKSNVCRKIELCGVKCASCPTCNQTCPDYEREHCRRLQKASSNDDDENETTSFTVISLKIHKNRNCSHQSRLFVSLCQAMTYKFLFS